MKINTLDGPVGWIVDKYYDWIHVPIIRFKASIENLISWFPIIWRDRDWDHWYFFKLLHFKLQRMEKCIREGHYEGCESDADDIQICVEALSRLIEDDYCTEEWDEIHKKWGEMKFIPCSDRPNCSIMTFENIKTEEDEKEHSKDIKRVAEKEEEEIKGDIYITFEVIKDNVLKWWD